MNQFAGNPFAGMTSGDQTSGTRHPFLGGDKGEALEGDYKLLVKRVAVRGRQKPYYIIEVQIEESNQPQRPVGMTCSCFIDLTNTDMRGKNISGFISAVFGVDPTTLEKDSAATPWDGQEWGAYAQWSVAEDNPLAERKIGCRVMTTITKNNTEFSVHNWVPYDMMIVPARVFAQPQPRPVAVPAAGFGQTGAFTPPAPPGPQPSPAPTPGGFKPGGGFSGGSWGGPK